MSLAYLRELYYTYGVKLDAMLETFSDAEYMLDQCVPDPWTEFDLIACGIEGERQFGDDDIEDLRVYLRAFKVAVNELATVWKSLCETYWVAYARGTKLDEMDIFSDVTEIIELPCPILAWVDVEGLIHRVFEMLNDRIPIIGGHSIWPL